MAMKPNTQEVVKYLRNIADADVTAADVAEATGLTKKQVDGIFTSALQKKGYGVRVPAEIELEDGTHANVKFLKLTDAGYAVDIEAEDA